MNKVPYYQLDVAAGASATTSVEIQKSDQVMFYVPAVAANFASGVVKAVLQGSYASGVTAITSYFYDYVNGTNAENAVTISTGGLYEFPNPGAAPYVKVKFDVAATVAVSTYLTTPKTTF